MMLRAQLYYSTIVLSSEKIYCEKQSNFVIYLFNLGKAAAKWQLLTLLFQKSEGDNKSQMCDILVAKGSKFSRNFQP